MSSLYGINSSGSSDPGFSWMFGGAPSATGSGGNVLGDYSLIRSGSYKKLLKAYYSNKETSSVETEADKTEKINLSEANQDAQSLNSSVTKLMNTEVSEDKREELKKELKNVIESYNSLVDTGSEVDDTNVLRNVLWMTKGTHANAAVLTDVGVTIGEGNKLSLDEEKFDKSNLSNISSLIKGNDSYMGRLASRAAVIARSAVNAISESSASAYTSSGSAYSSVTASSVIDHLT